MHKISYSIMKTCIIWASKTSKIKKSPFLVDMNGKLLLTIVLLFFVVSVSATDATADNKPEASANITAAGGEEAPAIRNPLSVSPTKNTKPHDSIYYQILTWNKYRVRYYLNNRLWAQQDSDRVGNFTPDKMQTVTGHEHIRPQDHDNFMVTVTTMKRDENDVDKFYPEEFNTRVIPFDNYGEAKEKKLTKWSNAEDKGFKIIRFKFPNAPQFESSSSLPIEQGMPALLREENSGSCMQRGDEK